jgi:hypothetical protein
MWASFRKTKLVIILAGVLVLGLELFMTNRASLSSLSWMRNTAAMATLPTYTVDGNARRALVGYQNCVGKFEEKVVPLPWMETCDFPAGSWVMLKAQRVARDEGEIHVMITGRGIFQEARAEGPLAETPLISSRVP